MTCYGEPAEATTIFDGARGIRRFCVHALKSRGLAGMGTHPKAGTHAAVQGLVPVTAPTHPDTECLQAVLSGMKDFPVTEPNRLREDDLRVVGH